MNKDAPRICVSGAFPDVASISAFVAANPEFSSLNRHLIEIRLDLVAGQIDTVFELITVLGKRAVVSCRPRWEGGAFNGSEGQRLELLTHAARCGAGLVDVELASWLRGGGEPVRRACADGCTVMVSVHETGSVNFLEDHVRKLNAVGAGAVKLACTTNDAGDLMALAAAGRKLQAPVVSVVGMGAGAAFTRMRPADFGANLTFASAAKGLETAPGQPDFRTLEAWRVFESRSLEPVALVGGPQVASSPGPDIYNRLFSALDVGCQYFPLPVSDWKQALTALEFFGIRKFAVTMPFKADPVAEWPDATCDDWVSVTGVANTVVIAADGAVSLYNTDAVGSRELFDRFGGVAGLDMLILGGGATARSVAAAAVRAGASVSVAARNPVKVSRSWQSLVTGVKFKGWERRGEFAHDVVVNATPIGVDGKLKPIDGSGLRARRAAIDVVVPAEGQTPFIGAAIKDKIQFAAGLDFWCAQAREQFQAFTGCIVDPGKVAVVMAQAGYPCPGVMSRRGPLLPGVGLDPVTLAVPGSKSLTQRYLALASLCRYPTRINNPSWSRDSRELLNGLAMLGVRFGQTSETIDVYPGDFPKNPGRPIATGEGGTTIRFLSALSLLSDFPLELVPSGTMKYRPMGPMWAALTALGVEVSSNEGVVSLARRASPGPGVQVEGVVSSQFASALLIAGFGLQGGLSVEIAGPLVSRPYLDMTIQAIRQFGGTVEENGQSFFVQGGHDVMGRRVNVEGDASLAAFWAAAGIIYGRRITLTNTPVAGPCMQGDAKYPELFAELDGDGPRNLNLSDTPDLLPPLMIAALFRSGKTRFSGVGHARAKESDRLTVLRDRLQSIGADIAEDIDSLTVTPTTLRGPAELDPAGDHRMAMTFGILSLRVPGITVSNPGCVDKSYPDFWQDLEMVRA